MSWRETDGGFGLGCVFCLLGLHDEQEAFLGTGWLEERRDK